MAPLVLNPTPPSHSASVLLSPSHLEHADAVISVGSRTFPAHRAVLALHSTHFLETAFSTPPPLRVALYHPSLSEETLAAGWSLIYDYLYEVTAPVAAPLDALAALHIADVWRFDDLADVLQSYIISHVHATNCISLYVAAAPSAPGQAPAATAAGASAAPIGPVPPPPLSPRLYAVRNACVASLKADFSNVSNWGALDPRTFAKFLKLNDIGGGPQHSEIAVFNAVSAWVAQRSSKIQSSAALTQHPAGDEVEGATSLSGAEPVVVPVADVEAIVKLIRFPTMPPSASAIVSASSLVSMYPVVAKYAAQIGRAPRFHITLETSPLFRPRRARALTFADRVTSFSRVDARMQTSARYFANCLWHLVVGKRAGFVELYLGVLAEEPGAAVAVDLDFTLYIAQISTTGSSMGDPNELPPMIRREVKRASFSRSGQRMGFLQMISLADVPDFARNDTLCIGASLRLRGCREHVDAIDDLVDHSASCVVEC